ncbi:MAG TPA: HAD-IA family hydrolase [Jatrophihabitantaceae bacterium]|jgi:putative hydrolase of the HAD superfamily|nr:HAD-IA family hydrolase [Jatrophihabitantaceae bacterium]
MAEPVDLVLFDLGGVLIDVPGVQAMLNLTGIASEDDLWRRWLMSQWVRRFESGRCTEAEFAHGVVTEWQLDLSPAAFLDAFRNWPNGPLRGAEQLVTETNARVRTGCFSNTNALHWDDHISTWPLMDLFDHLFLSFEMGMLKPDVAAFTQVAASLPVPAERVLFLDDNALNVAGAAAAGFATARAVGVDAARERLVEVGVLSPATETR